jgi:FMN phosphatase YigB (HAD superfamily)
MANVHSFDVFDTSLFRKVATPPYVFRLLARHIARKANIADEDIFIEDFLASRIRAEKAARSLCAETTLDQIWDILREMVPQLPSSCSFQDELDIERDQLLPNSIVARRIAELRSAGARIIFTSDTYYPEAFLREQLSRYGLFETGDGLYVSNAAGVAKWTGELFKVVLDREGIAPSDLHHYGDDATSDVAMPRRLGIQATLLSDAHLNIWENAVLSKDVSYRMAKSLLAGSMRAFRLSTAFQPGDGADELVATLLGPALVVWAAWVLSAAQRDGIRRLYFLSRDAYLLCRVARILAPHFGDIDCRHLRISRRSILLPATDEISPSKMPWLRRPSQPIRIGDLLVKLSLDWSNVAQHFSSLTKGGDDSWLLTTDAEWHDFWNILQNRPVADLVRKQIREKRSNALAYLRAEGLCDNVPAAVVDVGWYMEVQTSFRKLLEQGAGVEAPIGYFLGLGLDRMPPADAGRVTALFYEQAAYHQWAAPQYEIFKRVDVLDHVFGLAPYGSVSEYKITGSSVEPVGPSESKLHIEFVHKLGSAVEAFCKDVGEQVFFYSDGEIARDVIDTLIGTWCFHPNKPALAALGHIMVTDGTSAIPSQPLLQPWRLLDAIKTMIPWRLREKLRIRVYSPVWPEAAFYRSGKLVQFVFLTSAGLRLLRKRSRLELLSLFFKARRS